jgi:prolipoprotein diacylglyceryltransferase
MDHELMYCIVKTPHVWCVIVYRRFHNYDGVIFLYYHIFYSNYRLSIDTETFLFGFIRF